MNAQPIQPSADASPTTATTGAESAPASTATSTAVPLPRTTGASKTTATTASTTSDKKVFYDDREVYGM